MSESKSAGNTTAVKAKKKGPMSSKFKEIRIRPTDNGGAIVEHHLPHEERQKGGDGEFHYMPAPEPKTTAFTTGEEAHAHVADIMGLSVKGKNAEADSTAKPGKENNSKSGKETPEDKKDQGDNDEDDED